MSLEILKRLDARRARQRVGENGEAFDRWGIGTADVYMNQIADSVKGQVSPARWQKALEVASTRLTYCGPDMQPIGMDTDPPSGLSLDAGFELVPVKSTNGDIYHVAVLKGKRGARETVADAIGEFDAIVTSSRIDRDNDILEPKGANVDPNLALLWQHMPFEPIGRLVEILVQNSKRVKARFALADTALARDALVLVEFGALRISHGFIPTKWEDRTSKQGDWLGFHILEYDMIEVSLVSVPSNVDAIVTAFSSEKLAHPVVKGWAKTFYESRQTIVPGITLAKDSDGGDEGSPQDDIDGKEVDTAENRLNADFLIELPEAPSSEKAGRALSKANERHVEDALADVDAILAEDASRVVTALAERAKESLQAVLESVTSEGEEPKSFEATLETQSPGIGDVLAYLACASKDDAARAKRTVDSRLKLLDRQGIADLLGL